MGYYQKNTSQFDLPKIYNTHIRVQSVLEVGDSVETIYLRFQSSIEGQERQ